MNPPQSKIKITQHEYNTKVVTTTGAAIKAAVFSGALAAVTVPLVLWSLRRFIYTDVLTRLGLGLICVPPVGYFAALNKRTKSLDHIEKTYTY